MKILVTGGAGYIGSILCEHLLNAGHHVAVLDNLMYGSGSLFHLCHREGFEFVKGDARDEELLKTLIPQADVIIPLAAIVGAPACDTQSELARTVNTDAITSILWIKRPDQLVIYPTTNSGYGTQSGDTYCTEDTPLNPISVYGLTKQRAEYYTLLNRSNTISLRLATVFGCSPRMRLDLLVNDFTYKAVTDGYITIYEPHFKRNYVHIRDVAACFLHCIRNFEYPYIATEGGYTSFSMVGKAYNVGLDSANMSKMELALRIKQYVPDFDVYFNDVQKDPDQRNYIVSNQRLREAGFEAHRTLDQGIEELIKGYKMMGRGRWSNV